MNWLREWWETIWVWWHCDRETWAYLTNKKNHDPDDYVEVYRPEGDR